MTKITWQQLNSSLNMAELGAGASEAHGIVCGLICGGVNLEDGSWYGAFNDLMNDGIAQPIDLKKQLQALFDTSANEFVAGEYQVKLLLNEDGSIGDLAQSLAQWTGSFMAGFAIGNESGKKLNKEIKEALNDLSQISQLDSDIEDNEESAKLLEDISEYVRMTAMMCYSELGFKPKTSQDDKKIH